jgi:hypothetical protein
VTKLENKNIENYKYLFTSSFDIRIILFAGSSTGCTEFDENRITPLRIDCGLGGHAPSIVEPQGREMPSLME